MKDARGNTIYVGKAKDLHRRLGNYFSPTGTTLSNHKTRALINAIASFDYFETRNDQEAFLLESKLIKQYRPHYNIQMKDDKRYPLLKIPKGEKLPRFQLARVRKDDGARYFGPFVHSQALYATAPLRVLAAFPSMITTGTLTRRCVCWKERAEKALWTNLPGK